ncbi:MAG TPA: hypothetical protein DCM05_07775 [Elusimicrobia bacterium]|nr:hypothetical protein [Elusimicrobiota bacterium]
MSFHAAEIRLFRSLGDSARAGLSPASTLARLAEQEGEGDLREMARRLEEGGTLSEAMRAFPRRFPRWQTELIAASEAAGRLDTAFYAVAESLEVSRRFWLGLAPKAAYPLLLLHFTPFAVYSMTLGLEGVGPYLFKVVLFLLPFYLLGGAAWWLLRSPDAEARLRRLPFARGWMKARFCRMLALLMRAGLNFPKALELALEAAGLSAGRSLDSALGGAGFAETLGSLGLFAPTELDAFKTGELAGAYDRQLDVVASLTEERNEALLRTLAALLPPVIFIVVALFIASMILRFYSRLFTGAMPGF